RAAALAPAALDRVAIAVGPGGFTGIRAGLAAAQGIALATGARLIGVTSFAAVAAAAGRREGQLLVALDSRRDDFYVQLFIDGKPAAEPRALLPGGLDAYVGGGAVSIAGDAA